MDIAPKGRQHHLLVIEDNPADVVLLRRALAGAGLDYQLTVINDGAEALALFRPGRALLAADLAIVDLNLPKHSGLEVIEQMRANPAFAEMPGGDSQLRIGSARPLHDGPVPGKTIHCETGRFGRVYENRLAN